MEKVLCNANGVRYLVTVSADTNKCRVSRLHEHDAIRCSEIWDIVGCGDLAVLLNHYGINGSDRIAADMYPQ